MPTNIWLTNEPSDLSGYLRAKIGDRSKSASLVRTDVEIDLPFTLIGQWITDVLDGVILTAEPWVLHAWFTEAIPGTEFITTVTVSQFTNTVEDFVLSSISPADTTESFPKDIAVVTSAAIPTTINEGNRLLIRLYAGSEGIVTFSYNGFFNAAEGDTYLRCPNDIFLTTEVRSDTRNNIRQLLKDSSNINPQLEDEEIDGAFERALREYSIARPMTAMYYYSGDGSTYDFDLPRHWINGLSTMLSVEYPTEINPRVFLTKSDQWGLTNDWSGPQPVLKFRVRDVPQAGTDNILIEFTTGHQHNTDLSTIPFYDVHAIEWLSASYCARSLSAKSAATADSTITADVVNYRDGVTRWKEVAEQYLVLWNNHMFQSVSDTAASGIDEWDTTMSDRRDWVFHRRRFR